MVKKYMGVKKEEEMHPEADDFTLIHGIGPGIADRLVKAGIYTYAQLSALSPEEIVSSLGNLIGMTTKRVIDQDWKGQARELAAQQELSLAQRESDKESGDHQHYATFTIELLLGGENEVRRTRIVHIQSDAEEIWAGWEETRLSDFIIGKAELHLSKSEHKGAEIALDKAALLESPPPLLAGNPRLEELVTIPTAEDSTQRSLPESQPFGVRMTLDLSEVRSPKDTPLDYSTAVYAKMLGSGKRWSVGEIKGSCMPSEKVTIGIDQASLPEGVYRLEAAVVLKLLLEEKGILCPELNTKFEGGLLSIY